MIDERGCQEELEALHAAYFAAYVREWNHFLDTMHVVEPEGNEAIRALIEDMTITGGPTVNALEGLFLKVADNALLDPHPGEGGAAAGWLAAWASRGRGGRGGGAGGAQASVKSVRDALEPFYRYGYQAAAGEGAATTPLQAYASLLMRIGGPLGEHARTRDAAALEQARKHAADVFRLLYEEQLPIQHPQWRPVLERLLEPPIRGLLEEVRRGERDLLTQRWCNEVHGPFEAMKICYPFARDGACNASASEVAELFHPKNGALWRLYEEALSGRFPFQGDRYGVAAQGYGSRLRLNPQVAELLTHAKELGEVLFPGDAAEPRFAFSILFQPSTTASKITLDVDGSLIEYNNNHRDTFRPMAWPGGGGAPGATIVADTHMGEQRAHGEGFWGLFKLLEQGDVDQEQRFIRVRMRVGAAKDVQFTINPESGLGTPLFGRLRPDARLMDVFRAPRLQVPRNLFIGGMSCPSQLRPASPATSSP
ncbi:MAG: hypothetical protein H6710_16560 [Myxococcales bacterium]|nr:hypothetical protein [Myxococcales bacterium]